LLPLLLCRRKGDGARPRLAGRGEGEASVVLCVDSIFWSRRMPFSTLRCSDLELLALKGLEGLVTSQLSMSDVGGEESWPSRMVSTGVGGVGGCCCC